MEYLPEQNECDQDPGGPALGIFDRVNNYLLLIYAVACFFMYFSISGLLILRGSIILSLIVPGIIAFIIPMILLSRRFSLSFRREYRVEIPDPLTAALVLVVAGGSILPVDAIASYFERMHPPDADYINFLLSIKPKGVFALIATGFGTVIVTPLGEELLFRGFVQRIFQRNMRGYLAVTLASVIFALCHFSIALLPGVIILGALFGYIFYRTGNLLYPVFAHALYNLVSLIRLHAMSESAIEAAEISSPSVVWTVISALALLAGIYLLERRHTGEEPAPHI
ncbi:MAG TPA: type II CAAX endopeptidase family protein [Patescibacteria group bacterium]|nr:type II CAAX endopeptidase family protein [Patescibacteria group bacterium]